MPAVSQTVASRVPSFIAEAVKADADRLGVSQSEVVATILADYYDRLDELQPTGIQRAKERSAELDADTKALKLRYLKGELVPLHETRLMVRADIAVLKARIYAIPRVLPHLVPADVTALEKSCEDCLADLRMTTPDEWKKLRDGITWEELQSTRFNKESPRAANATPSNN